MYSFIWIVFLSWGIKKRVNCNIEDCWDKYVYVYMVKMFKYLYYMCWLRIEFNLKYFCNNFCCCIY